MDSAIETLGPTRVHLAATVPWDALDLVLREACAAGTPGKVGPAGFRTGRLPFHPIDQRAGGAVLPRAVETALLDLVTTVARQHSLEPLGRVDVEIAECTQGKPLRFTAVLDIRPDITVPDPSSLRIRMGPSPVTEDEVQACLDALREHLAEQVDVQRAAADGDLVDLDLRTEIDGAAVPGAPAGRSTCPQVKNRRNDPNVEPAYTWLNNRFIPPWRSRSRSSMLSAPATIAATIAAALPPGLDPVDRSGRTRSATRPARSTCSARAITGTNPAHDTRFGSSNTALTARRACNSRTYEMPSRSGDWKPRQLPFFQVGGRLRVYPTPPAPQSIGASRLSRCGPLLGVVKSQQSHDRRRVTPASYHSTTC